MKPLWQSTTVNRLHGRAKKHGLGALELAFPCVVCSFVVVVLLLCFCCCPLLLYRLRGEIGYNYLALLYFMFGLIVFGVVGESLLIARRRGRLPCCRDVERARPSFSSTAASDDRGALRDQPGVKAPLCHVHRSRPTEPPPAYDFSNLPRALKLPATKVSDVKTTNSRDANTLDFKTPVKNVDIKAITKNADAKKMTANSNIKTTKNMDVKTAFKNANLKITNIPDVKTMTMNMDVNTTKNVDVKTTIKNAGFKATTKTEAVKTTENVGSKTTDNVDIITTAKNAYVKLVTNDVNVNLNMNTDIQTTNNLDTITTTKNEDTTTSTEIGDTKMTDQQSDGDPTSKDADVTLKDDPAGKFLQEESGGSCEGHHSATNQEDSSCETQNCKATRDVTTPSLCPVHLVQSV